MKRFDQDPGEKLDYQVTLTGDTVASATAAIAPTGPTLGTVTTTSTTAKVRVSDLTLGTRYTLTLHVTGTSGQQYERSAELVAVNR